MSKKKIVKKSSVAQKKSSFTPLEKLAWKHIKKVFFVVLPLWFIALGTLGFTYMRVLNAEKEVLGISTVGGSNSILRPVPTPTPTSTLKGSLEVDVVNAATQFIMTPRSNVIKIYSGTNIKAKPLGTIDFQSGGWANMENIGKYTLTVDLSKNYSATFCVNTTCLGKNAQYSSGSAISRSTVIFTSVVSANTKTIIFVKLTQK